MDQRVSGTMLVKTGWMAKDRTINKAKSFEKEFVDAYRVDAKDFNVVLWFYTKSERRMEEIKDEVLATRGVKGLQLKIGSGISVPD